MKFACFLGVTVLLCQSGYADEREFRTKGGSYNIPEYHFSACHSCCDAEGRKAFPEETPFKPRTGTEYHDTPCYSCFGADGVKAFAEGTPCKTRTGTAGYCVPMKKVDKFQCLDLPELHEVMVCAPPRVIAPGNRDGYPYTKTF